jgi:uncharacterized integral membrane protein
MRVTGWILLLLAIIVAVGIAVDNRSDVAFSLWPLDWVLELPLFLVLFAGFLIGLVLGLTTEWWRARRWRREARMRRREVEALTSENARLKAAAGSPPAVPG